MASVDLEENPLGEPKTIRQAQEMQNDKIRVQEHNANAQAALQIALAGL